MNKVPIMAEKEFDPKDYKREVVELLLAKLRSEITHGMCQGDLEPELSCTWFVPHSDGGVVKCEFRCRPDRYHYSKVMPIFADVLGLRPGSTQGIIFSSG
jgi:hypothetical protein